VQGLALSGIAAENLEAGSGIPSRTIASLEHAWSKERDLLGPREVLVIDEAGMIGSRQLERVLTEAERRGPKSCSWAIPNNCNRSRRAQLSARLRSGIRMSRSAISGASTIAGSAMRPRR